MGVAQFAYSGHRPGKSAQNLGDRGSRNFLDFEEFPYAVPDSQGPQPRYRSDSWSTATVESGRLMRPLLGVGLDLFYSIL